MNVTLQNIDQVLKMHNLRSTKPRRELAGILSARHPCHCTAEQLYNWAHEAGLSFNLQTIYNTLNQFVQLGLIHKLNIDTTVSYYDTNLEPHHHLYNTTAQQLVDIPIEMIQTTINWDEIGVDLDSNTTDIVIHCG